MSSELVATTAAEALSVAQASRRYPSGMVTEPGREIASFDPTEPHRDDPYLDDSPWIIYGAEEDVVVDWRASRVSRIAVESNSLPRT